MASVAPAEKLDVTVGNNELRLFVESAPYLDALLEDIRTATKRVWIESYTIADDAAGRAVAEDPELAPGIIEVPRYTGTTKLSAYGATLRLSGRVQPEQRIKIEVELRRRVAAELAASGVTPIRPTGPPPATSGTERTR